MAAGRALLAAGCLALAGACQPAAEPAKPAPAAAPAKRAPGKAVLDAGGVTFDASPGRTIRYPFGTSRAVVEAAADPIMGPASNRSTNAECGAEPLAFTQYGTLTLNYRNGKLAGWLAREGPQVVTTDGIKPGVMMRDLAVTRSARPVAGSTLAGEFEYVAADGQRIGGFTRGAGDGAAIDSLYAGVNCFFR